MLLFPFCFFVSLRLSFFTEKEIEPKQLSILYENIYGTSGLTGNSIKIIVVWKLSHVTFCVHTLIKSKKKLHKNIWLYITVNNSVYLLLFISLKKFILYVLLKIRQKNFCWIINSYIDGRRIISIFYQDRFLLRHNNISFLLILKADLLVIH